MKTLAPVNAIRQTQGLYTLQEVAAYAKAPEGSLRYWLYGDKNHPAFRNPLISHTEGRFLTFVEFIEAMAIRTLTRVYRVSLRTVWEAIREAEETYNLEYPFSKKTHKTYLVGKDLYINKLGEDEFVAGLTGREKKQLSWVKVLEPYMMDLTWDDQQRAASYTAYNYNTQHSSSVILIQMKPQVYFGAPMVGNTGYTAETLWRAALAEGDFARTAQYYEVRKDDVIAAWKYCEEEIRLVA